MMAGASGVRLPGVMAAAAALATAATSADFPHSLHHKTPSTLFYSSNLSSSTFSSSSSAPYPVSSCSQSAFGNIPLGVARTCFASSLPVAQEACCAISPFQSTCPSPRALSHLLPCNLSRNPIFPPASLCSSYRLPREELHRHFSGQTARFMPSSTLNCLSSSQFNPEVSFPVYNLSQQVAALFNSSSSLRLSPTVGTWNSLHTWHTPTPGTLNPGVLNVIAVKSKPAVTVVLLGWLGSQQKHLKKYAEWYNARGIHAVTFTVPMADLLSFAVGGKAEAHVDQLTSHLAMWLDEEYGDKHLIFHTFSNTGWLTYGVVLEKLQARGSELVDKIRGCVVDSAPSADPDPQVWASGFSAALLKKRSTATHGSSAAGEQVMEKLEPHIAETALLVMLEKFFSLFLQIPAINQRLTEVVNILKKKQPDCPQLYIYSTADKVIPAKSVEAFIEKQRQTGRIVRAINLHSSPHVDHFRSFPEIYGKQVSSFLQECASKR